MAGVGFEPTQASSRRFYRPLPWPLGQPAVPLRSPSCGGEQQYPTLTATSQPPNCAAKRFETMGRFNAQSWGMGSKVAAESSFDIVSKVDRQGGRQRLESGCQGGPTALRLLLRTLTPASAGRDRPSRCSTPRSESRRYSTSSSPSRQTRRQPEGSGRERTKIIWKALQDHRHNEGRH